MQRYHFATKAQQTILTKMVKRIFVCCFAVARFNRSARSQGLRNVDAYTPVARGFQSFVSVGRPFALLRPRRYARFERRGHSTHESSHSRINNVRRRTKILPPTAFSRAKETDKQSRLTGKVRSGSLAPMTGLSIGLAEYKMANIIIVNDTHSSR